MKKIFFNLNYKVGLIILIVLAFSCSWSNYRRYEKVPLADNIFEEQIITGEITDPRLNEVSGLVASVKNPGYFWTHNDSGGKPWLYLIDTAGNIQLTVKLEGLKNRDWEDLTYGGGKIFIGEIGDNSAKRKAYRIYQIEEPKLDTLTSIQISKDSIGKMIFMYSNGPRDAETLIYDHFNGELVVVSKRDEEAFIYSFPFVAGKTLQTIPPIGTIAFTQFTAGASSENGEFVIKNYDYILYWKASKASVSSRLLNESPVRIPYNEEPQGEAITFDSNGDLITATEKVEGYDQDILRFRRK